MNILINGFPRSGTTITFNLCREISRIVSGQSLVEHGCHTVKSKKYLDKYQVVTVLRNPIFCWSSMVNVGTIKLPNIATVPLIKMYKNCLDNIKNSKGVMFAYESYLPENNKSLIRFLSKEIFNIILDEQYVDSISNSFCVSKVKNEISGLKNFDQQNKTSLFHGNHITTDGNGSSLIIDKYEDIDKLLANRYIQEYIDLHTSLLKVKVKYTVPKFIQEMVVK